MEEPRGTDAFVQGKTDDLKTETGPDWLRLSLQSLVLGFPTSWIQGTSHDLLGSLSEGGPESFSRSEKFHGKEDETVGVFFVMGTFSRLWCPWVDKVDSCLSVCTGINANRDAATTTPAFTVFIPLKHKTVVSLVGCPALCPEGIDSFQKKDIFHSKIILKTGGGPSRRANIAALLCFSFCS